MGGYSEFCPICGRSWMGPGITSHVKDAHPQLYAYWHNERYGGDPGTGVKKRYYSGAVSGYGSEDEIDAPDS